MTAADPHADRRESRRIRIPLSLGCTAVVPVNSPAQRARETALTQIERQLDATIDAIEDPNTARAIHLLRQQVELLLALPGDSRAQLESVDANLSAEGLDFDTAADWPLGTLLRLCLLLPDAELLVLKARVTRAFEQDGKRRLAVVFLDEPQHPLRALRRFLLTYPDA